MKVWGTNNSNKNDICLKCELTSNVCGRLGSGGKSRRVDGNCESPTMALNVLSQDTRILGRLDCFLKLLILKIACDQSRV